MPVLTAIMYFGNEQLNPSSSLQLSPEAFYLNLDAFFLPPTQSCSIFTFYNHTVYYQ